MTQWALRPAGPLRGEVLDLLGRLDPDGQELVVGMLAGTTTETVLGTPDMVRRAVHSYAWLLDRVGDDGITLTSSGYLPPAVVRGAMAVIGDEHWIGLANREHHTMPVLELRESAVRMGLLRKRRGQLLITAAGRAARGDDQRLFEHLTRGAPDAADPASKDAGFLLLLAVSAGAPVTFRDVDQFVVRAMTSLGWARADGLLRPHDGYDLARRTMALLRSTAGLAGRRGDQDRCTEVGRFFARAARTPRLWTQLASELNEGRHRLSKRPERATGNRH